ncbi:TPA: head-tail connector protein [Raoultella terrigena]
MSDTLTLDDVKLHCRIDADDTSEDVLLQAYIDASLEVCQTHIGKRFDSGLIFSPAMKVGCMMYVGQLYESREMVSEAALKEVPMAISALWSVYRDVGVY